MTLRLAPVRRVRLLVAAAIPVGILVLALVSGARAETSTLAEVPFATPSPLPSLIPGPPAPTPLPHPAAGETNQCYECHKAVNHRQESMAGKHAGLR